MKPLTMFLATLALGGGSARTAAAPATTMIAALHGDTAISAFGGVQAWSDYDAAAKQWHVVVRRGGQLTTPSIPGAKAAIEVAVGPGAGGGPVLAYVGCTDACRVVVSRLDGSAARAVPGSAGASHPAIWGARVAWVRGPATVMTAAATARSAPRSCPARRPASAIGRSRATRDAARYRSTRPSTRSRCTADNLP